MKDRVSFIIPTYNSAAWLPHSVESCQQQTHKDIEIIIIDDCSTDTTPIYIDWLVRQGDSRIVYKCNEKNMGRSYSRNLGNNIATGDVVCILDADDLAIDKRAEWTLKKLKKCQVCYGSAVFMDAIGTQVKEKIAKPIDRIELLKPMDMEKWEESLKTGEKIDLREIGIVHSSVGMLREIALKYPYEEGPISDLGIDDWAQQISMLRDGIIFDFIPDIICAYRLLGQGISSKRNPLDVIKLKAKIINSKCETEAC